jgi:hypothetical protein
LTLGPPSTSLRDVSDQSILWALIGFGGWLMIHCPRAALKEYRNGVAKGTRRTFARQVHPAGFWLTIGATSLAGLTGLIFFLFGIVAVTNLEHEHKCPLWVESGR